MGSLAGSETSVRAETVQAQQGSGQCGASLQLASSREGLQGIQFETSDMALYELFFLEVLHAEEVQRIDHPQIDLLRGYCYRNVLIVVRQDVRTPRPTGWVQVNFSVADVGAVQACRCCQAFLCEPGRVPTGSNRSAKGTEKLRSASCHADSQGCCTLCVYTL